MVTVVQNNERIIVVDPIPIVSEEHSLPIFFHPGLQAGQSNTISFGSILLKVAFIPLSDRLKDRKRERTDAVQGKLCR